MNPKKIDELIRSLISDESFEKISDLVLKTALELTGSKIGYVGYVDQNAGYLICPAFIPHEDPYKEPIIIEQYDGLWGFVFKNRKSVISNRIKENPNPFVLDYPIGKVYRFLSSPVIYKGFVIGNIALANSDKDYENDHILTLERLAAIYALAIRTHTLELNLEKEKRHTNHMTKIQNNLLNNLCHEIKTPLSGFMGLSELLLQTKLDEQQSQYMNLLKSTSDSLSGVINDLIDYSRCEQNTLTIIQNRFNLSVLIASTINSLKTKAHEKGLNIIDNISDDIPQFVVGDSGRLRQIINILAKNAIMFTNSGNIAIRVRRGFPSNGPCANSILNLFVSVEDTGIGIPGNMLDQIFEPFYQVDTTLNRSSSGLGLGLTIAKYLVEKMGGKIWVESELDKGSKFHFNVKLMK